MTSIRQLKQVYRQITDRHADALVVGRRFLWVKPVRHVARRFFIDRTSSRGFASPRWNIQETFLANRNLVHQIGHYGFHYMRVPHGPDEIYGDSWQWADSTMVPQLIALIENEVLPFLRSFDTLENYAACYRGFYDKSFVEHPEDRMVVDIALGDLDTARASCLKLLPEYRENKNFDWDLYQALRTQVVTVAEPLMAGDRKALAAILHGWEAANIRGTMLEPHWEPTPFPLEA